MSEHQSYRGHQRQVWQLTSWHSSPQDIRPQCPFHTVRGLDSGFLRPSSLLLEQHSGPGAALPWGPRQYSRLFLAPEVVDSKGNCNEDQVHGHCDKALHPGLQVPPAWKGEQGSATVGWARVGAASTERRGTASNPEGWSCVRGRQPAARTRGDILGWQGWEGAPI